MVRSIPLSRERSWEQCAVCCIPRLLPLIPPAPFSHTGLKGGDLGRFQALGRVIDMHGDAVTYFGQGLRAQPQADPTTPLRQQPAQAPTCPPPEQADHPLRRAAPATAQRCARRRRRPPQATGRNPLLFCIFDPRADGHRPQRDRRHHQLLPGHRIRVRHLTALPVPAHRRTLAEARLVPTAQGIPRGIHPRG
jgi:hypothetical protein